jgi:ATP-binding cassette subfamily B protein/subfamily B ATP-binding cassette protein MsbA
MELPEHDCRSPSMALSNNGDGPPRTSRSRFSRYRNQVRKRELPTGGGFHGNGDSRPQRPRSRSATQLVWDFLRLLRPFRKQVIWILAAATVATLIGLLPPAGTKFIIDYALSGRELPPPWLARFPELAAPADYCWRRSSPSCWCR